MGFGPDRPLNDIQAHLKRGELQLAIAVAKDFRCENNRPIPIAVALLYLPVVLMQRPDDYDHWSCRLLARWLTETPRLTAERAANLADALAELKLEPATIEAVRTAAGVR